MIRRLHARRHESGAAAVEFALVLMPLMLLIFGIIQYGMYFWARQSAVAAAREGERRASVGDYATCTGFQDFVKSEINGQAANNTVTVTRSYPVKATGNTLTTGQVGDTMKVTVSFQ